MFPTSNWLYINKCQPCLLIRWGEHAIDVCSFGVENMSDVFTLVRRTCQVWLFPGEYNMSGMFVPWQGGHVSHVCYLARTCQAGLLPWWGEHVSHVFFLWREHGRHVCSESVSDVCFLWGEHLRHVYWEHVSHACSRGVENMSAMRAPVVWRTCQPCIYVPW